MSLYKSILVVLIFLLVSCAKDNKEDSIQIKIEGKWNWAETNGGFTGKGHYTPENTGDVREFVFNKDNTFYEILNSDTIQATDYFISREESILLQREFDFLTINYKYYLPYEDTIIILPMRHMINEITNTLKINEDVYDGFEHIYVRN